MLIDCHSHIWNPLDDYDAFWKSDRLVIEAYDKLGIDIGVISHLGWPVGLTTPETFRKCNRCMLAALEEFRGRFWGYCHVNPGYTKEALEEIDYCINADEDCVGLKLYCDYKINDPAVRPVIEKCIELDIPILEHSGHYHYCFYKTRKNVPHGSDAGDIADAGRLYPEAKIIVAHLGGGGDWEWQIKALRGASANVGADISGSVVDEGMVEYAVRQLGGDRVFFGCDGAMTASAGKLMSANISDEDRRKIGSENFLRLVGREELVQ